MDSESAMTAAFIDPQLKLIVQGTSAEGMQYHHPLSTLTAFEPWNSMFESIGELPQPAQDMGMMGSDLYSDETSSLSFSLSTEQDMKFPLSPLEGSANLDESPGGTSISTGLSEAGTSTDQKTPKAKQAKKARRRRSETEKKKQIKQRNRVAASKCRQKKKAKVDELKEIKSSLEARNNDLHMEYQRLRQEIGQVKSDLIHHTECNDSNINRWVENEAKGYVEKLVRNDERQRMGSISSADGVVDAMHMSSLHETAMLSKDPYMGLD
ncbi:hypothetical protein GGI35DRAFT_405795 [Trichoderma velutinum]